MATKKANSFQARAVKEIHGKWLLGIDESTLTSQLPGKKGKEIFLEDEVGLMRGDLVEVSLKRDRRGARYLSAKLEKIIKRRTKDVFGYITPHEGRTYVVSAAKGTDLAVLVSVKKGELEAGTAVKVSITKYPTLSEPVQGKIVEVYGRKFEADTDLEFIAAKHDLRTDFNSKVLAEAKKIPDHVLESEIAGRKDLRKLPFITIDGKTARDFDDAVYAVRTPNNNIKLFVAIADVSHYVKPGSIIDREAYERGTSVYFPSIVLPMLPERLSNGICSLNPEVDRLTLCCEIEFNKKGEVVDRNVFEAVFKSHRRCTYEEIQDYIDNSKENEKAFSKKVQDNIKDLLQLFSLLKKRRSDRGALEIDIPEMVIELDSQQECENIHRPQRLDSHKLIEECMIAANEAVSEIMIAKGLEFIYRVHEPPEADRVNLFAEQARNLGVAIRSDRLSHTNPKSFQPVIKELERHRLARIMNFLLLRSMRQAFYFDKNLGHFGLASKAYTHFTSPIRRYPDLIVHRLLKRMIYQSKDKVLATSKITLAQATQHCSQQERIAIEAERDMNRMKQVRYAEKHLGEVFMATVIAVTPKGMFLELNKLFLEGFLPVERLGDTYLFVEKEMCLKAKRSGKRYRLGDNLEVQISRTNVQLGQVELEPLEVPESTPKRHGRDYSDKARGRGRRSGSGRERRSEGRNDRRRGGKDKPFRSNTNERQPGDSRPRSFDSIRNKVQAEEASQDKQLRGNSSGGKPSRGKKKKSSGGYKISTSYQSAGGKEGGKRHSKTNKSKTGKKSFKGGGNFRKKRK